MIVFNCPEQIDGRFLCQSTGRAPKGGARISERELREGEVIFQLISRRFPEAIWGCLIVMGKVG
jgi:hypothetical protein